MTARGHIYWGHTLFSKISIIFIVVKGITRITLLGYRKVLKKSELHLLLIGDILRLRVVMTPESRLIGSVLMETTNGKPLMGNQWGNQWGTNGEPMGKLTN